MDYKKLLKIASFDPMWLQPPPAWVGHMPFAYWLMQEIKPIIMVELGTHSGNSYFSFCQSVFENKLMTSCYAVDTWKGDAHSGSYDEDVFEKVLRHNQKYPFSTLMRSTFDDAVSSFEDKSIDVLHIDGLHTYEAVKHDFETWQPKLSMSAVVLFHDTQVKHLDFGVWKFWEELKQTGYPNMDFHHCNGLGVIAGWGYDWLHSPELIGYFTALGLHQMERYEAKIP